MTMKAQNEEAVKGEEYSDDALATMAEDLAAEADRLFRLARGAHQELEQRMRDRDATKLDTEHWTGTLKPGAISHMVDDVQRLLKRLTPLIPEGAFEAAFVQPPTPPIRVDHRGLNELHKRGGEIADIIDEERRSVRSDGRLELKRKPEAE